MLLEYLFSHGESPRIQEVQELGVLDRIIEDLRSEDLDLRERVLSLIVSIMKTKDGASILQRVTSLESRLAELDEQLGCLSDEDRDCRELEVNLIKEFKDLKTTQLQSSDTKESSSVLLLK